MPVGYRLKERTKRERLVCFKPSMAKSNKLGVGIAVEEGTDCLDYLIIMMVDAGVLNLSVRMASNARLAWMCATR